MIDWVRALVGDPAFDLWAPQVDAPTADLAESVREEFERRLDRARQPTD